MELNEIVMNIFMFIGIVVCVIFAVIAMVWAVCFAFKMLVGTFSEKVSQSKQTIIEDMRAKAEAKRERNKERRLVKNQQKEELLKLKIASDERINEMKKQKKRAKLLEKEKQVWNKMFGNMPDAPAYVGGNDSELELVHSPSDNFQTDSETENFVDVNQEPNSDYVEATEMVNEVGEETNFAQTEADVNQENVEDVAQENQDVDETQESETTNPELAENPELVEAPVDDGLEQQTNSEELNDTPKGNNEPEENGEDKSKYVEDVVYEEEIEKVENNLDNEEKETKKNKRKKKGKK